MFILDKMKKLILMLISVFLVGSAFAIESSRITGEYQTVGSPSINVQYYEPGYFSSLGYTSPEIYWPFFDKDTCRERQDFIVQVTPAGCEPAVVRSDLLEEQNVPVFAS